MTGPFVSSPGMADRRKGSRVTPKGGSAGTGPRARPPEAGGRYTPPIPREARVSPTWVPVLMFALLGVGVMTIILNYLNLLPGDASNKYLLLGLAFITGGVLTPPHFPLAEAAPSWPPSRSRCPD